MWRAIVEFFCGYVVLRFKNSIQTIEIEVTIYMLTFPLLTNRELDLCIQNYTENVDYFEKKIISNPPYEKLYNRALEVINIMLQIFKTEKEYRIRHQK